MPPGATASTQDSTAKVSPHSVAAKAVHWGFIGVFLYALTKQLDEVEEGIVIGQQVQLWL